MGTEAAAAGPPSLGPAELLGGQRPAGRGALSPTLWSVEEAGLGTACAATSAHSFGREASPRAEPWFTEPRAMALVLGKASRPLRVSVQVHCLGKPGVTAALALLAAVRPRMAFRAPLRGGHSQWGWPERLVIGVWPGLCAISRAGRMTGPRVPLPPAGSRPGTGRHGRSPGGRPTWQVLLDDSSSGHSQHTFLA